MTGERGVRHPRVSIVLTLGLLTAAAPISLDMYSPALPAIASDFDSMIAFVQLTLMACFLGLGLGQVVGGPLGDRFGRRRPLLVGTSVFVLASLGCVVAPSIAVLIPLRFLQGLSGAVGIVMARAIAKDLTEGRATGRVYAQMAAISAGQGVLAPLLGAVIANQIGWRAVFVAIALLGAIMLLSVALSLPETLPASRRTAVTPWHVVRLFAFAARERSFRLHTAALFFSGATFFSWVANAPFVMKEVFALGAVDFSVVIACVALGVVSANMAGSRLLAAVEPGTLLRVAGITQVAGALGLVVASALESGGAVTPLPLFVALLLFTVAPFGLITPLTQAMAMTAATIPAGAASALLGLSLFTAGALVSPLSRFGDPAIVMCATMFVCAVATILLLRGASSTPGHRSPRSHVNP